MNTSDEHRGVSRSGKFAVGIVVVYAILAGGLWYGGIVGHVLYVGLISTVFWAVYVAGPLAIVLWLGRLVRRRGRGAIKSAVLIFGTIGLVLWIVAVIPPSSRTFSSGYWIHAKLWADIDEIRTWATERKPSADRFEEIPIEQWPASLRSLSVADGTVTCDPKTFTVIFCQDGQYGHWGITVAAPGVEPPDENNEIKLQNGAWVWCE
ncbi:MAG: hypothetical protein HN350_20680 [Phycisphaerales bacterium]|nr:hypothetical protein [Phycisphaerales bacterium]